MYAIKTDGYRAISSADQAQLGETVVEEIPQSLIDSMNATAASKAANEANLRAQADTALVELRTFRDLPSPTNAQTLAAVKLLCRVVIGLIRLRLGKLDAQD